MAQSLKRDLLALDLLAMPFSDKKKKTSKFTDWSMRPRYQKNSYYGPECNGAVRRQRQPLHRNAILQSNINNMNCSYIKDTIKEGNKRCTELAVGNRSLGFNGAFCTEIKFGKC